MISIMPSRIMTHERPDAILMVSNALTMLNRKRVVEGECKRTLIAHLVRDEGVAGSNPATPTTFSMVYER